MTRTTLAFALTACALFAAVGPVHADADELFDAMGLPRILEIMRDEGLSYGESIEEDLFPGRGGAGWTAAVGRIYATDRMEDEMRADFEAGLTDTDLDPLIAFFDSERGQRIVEVEISARRAIMDEDIEDAAREAGAALETEDPERFGLLMEFVEANDLVEQNVAGAMNSNYAFYMGLMDGDAFGGTLTEPEVLRDVWEQEPEIRADTEAWVLGYLGLAYGPLPPEDLEAYIALSESREGRALNNAMFSAFGAMFERISRELGFAAAGFIAGQDI